MSADVQTFGCRLNAYESEVMRKLADEAGHGNTVIINTCAVTAEAERQARQAIRRARRERPDAHIIATGCAVQVNPDAYAAMPEVDRVLGNAEKLTPAAFASRDAVLVNDIMTVKETASHLIEGFDGRARAFVQVQQGCDHRCTFCIIPFGRGNSRSVPIGAITEQIRTLVENGYSEIVLSGVDLTSYGPDLPGQPSLGQMIRRVLQNVPDLKRLRLSSIDCIEIDEDLLRLIADEPRLMPHLHLSLQSGSDMILKRMKRRHSRRAAVDLCDRIRLLRPDIVFGADLIAGFPTETGEMFEDTRALVEDCGLTWLHVFPYSERLGTPAAKMPPVPVPVRKERAAQLRADGRTAEIRHLDRQVGTNVNILIEKDGIGRTDHYAPVRLSSPATTDGAIVNAHIVRREGPSLVAEPRGQRAA